MFVSTSRLRPNAADQVMRWARNIPTEEMMTEATWTAPEACEVCVGMEVTSYMSAEI
jgi:coenzyme PQQ precursor peptide PqqA